MLTGREFDRMRSGNGDDSNSPNTTTNDRAPSNNRRDPFGSAPFIATEKL